MALSLDEALGVAALDEGDKSIHIDLTTRQVVIPESEKLFGVESDDAVEVKHIVIDGRYTDAGKDISELSWRVNFRNANGDKNVFPVTKVTAGDDSVEFDWIIRRSVVAYKGSIDFVVCAFGKDSDGKLTPEWNSTLGHGDALEGLEVDAEDIGGDEILDELKSLQVDMKALSDSAAKSASDALDSKNAAAQIKTEVGTLGDEKKKAITDESVKQQESIQKKGNDTLASIPEDYKQLTTDVSQLKEDLDNTASIVEENLVRQSANLINPSNMLENTAIVITNVISTSSNTSYKSYLNIPVKAGESYYIGNSHRVSCVINNAENKKVLQFNTQNKTDPFIFNVEKSGLLCVCFYMTEEKPWVALAEKETEYEEYGSKLSQEWLKLQIEKYGYSNLLKGKTIYNFGDSISNGQGNLVGDKRLGPAELVALDNDMVCTDFSVSGSTMSTAGGGNYILKRIESAILASPITPDFVLLAGGINDLKVTTVGDFSDPSNNNDFEEAYINSLDTSKFSGAFETAIYKILNKWPGTQLIFMTEHKMPNHYNDGTETLYQTAKKICKKWCVPILDMWNSGGLNMSVLANNKAYGTGDVNLDGTHTDTTHPNGEAYRLYYVPKLKAKLLECCPKTD